MLLLIDSNEIASNIEHLLIKNEHHFPIRRVVRKGKKITEQTLLFHSKRANVSLESINAFSDILIITNDLDVLGQIDNGMVMYVADVRKAYWEFVDFYRGRFQLPVIGVTGTCGKTTVKEMLLHILREKYKVQGTFWSQNGTHLNLPYLLKLKKDTGAAVYEMGVAIPGNIRHSGRYFKPEIGIITNIGEAHLDGCRTLEKYIKAKGELLEVLPENGTLIINGDDENIKKLPISSFKGKVLTFGIKESADFQALNIRYDNGGMSFQLRHENNNYPIFIQEYGEHQIHNCLAAIAAAYVVGMSIEAAVDRVDKFKGLPRHTRIFNGPDGCTVIDDTWSCNPSSVRSALSVLKSFSREKKELFILGKMQRLGKQLYQQHKKIAEALIEMGGVDVLITVGAAAATTGKRAIELGMHPANVFFVETASELETLLEGLKREDAVMLFKMSLGKMPSSYGKVVQKYRCTIKS